MKKRMRVLISSGLLKDFKLRVLEKHGKLQGALGESTEEALRLWLKIQKR